jgi:integrase
MDKEVAGITALEVEQWRMQYRRDQHTKAATLNRYVTTLKAALNWAAKHKIIAVNPLSGLESLDEEDSDRKVRYLSDAERERLFAALDAREAAMKTERANRNQFPDLTGVAFVDHLKPMVLVSLGTGIRRGSLFKLQWSDIDFQEGILTVRAISAKDKETLYIPMNGTVASTLRAWRDQTHGCGDALVFPSPKTGGLLDNCRKSWGTLLKNADIKNFRWHDMRHDFASQLVMKGVDLNTVRELLGHADMKMTLRYAHLAPRVKKAAVEMLG